MEEGWEIFHNYTSISQSVTIYLLGQWLILVAAAWTDMKLWLQINQAGIIPQNDRPGIGNNILTNSQWPQPGLLAGLLAACKNVNMSWTGVPCPAHVTPELDICLKQKEMLTSDLSRSCSQSKQLLQAGCCLHSQKHVRKKKSGWPGQVGEQWAVILWGLWVKKAHMAAINNCTSEWLLI